MESRYNVGDIDIFIIVVSAIKTSEDRLMIHETTVFGDKLGRGTVFDYARNYATQIAPPNDYSDHLIVINKLALTRQALWSHHLDINLNFAYASGLDGKFRSNLE